MKVKLATNDFFGVPFPLVLADRFFHVYGDLQGKMTLDVFRWDEDQQAPYYEVEASKPIEESIETNPTGIITFGDTDGGFLFKFRPKPGVSQIFGRVPLRMICTPASMTTIFRSCGGTRRLRRWSAPSFLGSPSA